MNCHLLYLLFASNVLLQLFLFSAFFCNFKFQDFTTDWLPGVTARKAPTYPEILVHASAYLHRAEIMHVFGCKFLGCRAVILCRSISNESWLLLPLESWVETWQSPKPLRNPAESWQSFFFLVNNCQTSWSGTMQDWIGKGQSNSLLLPFEVGI